MLVFSYLDFGMRFDVFRYLGLVTNIQCEIVTMFESFLNEEDSGWTGRSKNEDFLLG